MNKRELFFVLRGQITAILASKRRLNIFFLQKNLHVKKKHPIFALALRHEAYNDGAIAQLVEQRTENPCVPGSIPGGTTKNHSKKMKTSEFQRIQRFSFCFNCAKHADLGISIVPNSWLFLSH